MPDVSSKHARADTVKTIGERLKLARELCAYSQVEAARRLGYKNPSRLSKLEHATDVKTIPTQIIIKAAQVYDVSADYLLGLSDDWEADERVLPDRVLAGFVSECWEAARARDLAAVVHLKKQVATIETVSAEVVKATQDAKSALARFQELNPRFQDMSAGARLVHYIDRATDTALSMRNRLERIRVKCRLVRPLQNNLDLLEQ